MDYDKLASDRLDEPSEAARERVEAARQIQRARFERALADGELPEGRHLTCNARADAGRHGAGGRGG